MSVGRQRTHYIGDKCPGGHQDLADLIEEGRARARQWGIFICPRCGATSHNAKDAKEGYCGRCHAFTAAPLEGGMRDA